MLEVLALMSTEAAGTLAFEFTVHPLLGASLETAYGAYVSTGPCSRGKPWETQPLEWWTSSWAALRWTLSEWSRGETPSLPIARPRTSLGSLEEATELRGSLGACADDAAETTCDALAELVGPPLLKDADLRPRRPAWVSPRPVRLRALGNAEGVSCDSATTVCGSTWRGPGSPYQSERGFRDEAPDDRANRARHSVS